MATALTLEAPTPQLLRRIVDGRWVLSVQRPLPVRARPASPAPQADARLQRRLARCSPGPML